MHSKAKPPTKAEREWMAWLVGFGCIACYLDGNMGEPAAVHHMVSGNRRLGHRFTLPLCDPGHHQNGEQFGMISRHPWKKRFEAKYGTEAELLEWLRARRG
jgi:hypothetical protein